jgi:hypothetical protein
LAQILIKSNPLTQAKSGMQMIFNLKEYSINGEIVRIDKEKHMDFEHKQHGSRRTLELLDAHLIEAFCCLCRYD